MGEFVAAGHPLPTALELVAAGTVFSTHTPVAAGHDIFESALIESYLVDGMGHAYPGPAGQGLFTDRAGPDSSSIAWDFAKSHPRRR